MRIIDNNKDFYDYYQGVYPDDSLTFDRRDSYVLSREEFARYFRQDVYYGYYGKRHIAHDSGQRFILLQICHRFWLFSLNIIKTDDYGNCLEYSLSLLTSWKNYNAKRELIKLSHIRFHLGYWWWKNFTEYKDERNIQTFVNAINTHDYKEERVFDYFVLYKDNQKYERHIPIFKNIGIASEVSALDVYLALEEYFSMQKTDSERTESIGLTNDDKITMHGFDTKTSFRGK